jgi:hypothetical protein
MKWSEVAERFVRDNAERLTDAEGSMQLSRILGERVSVRSWSRKRQELGIKKKSGRGVTKLGMPACG